MYPYHEGSPTPRRKPLCRSISTPTSRQSVILHRPRSSSPTTAHWSLTRARHALLDSCWGSGSTSRAAVAMGMAEDLISKETRNVTACGPSQWVAGREKRWWCELDEEVDSEPESSSPSTPVFARHSGLTTTRQSPRCITLMSTLVIALALAALAFTTFFHPTFGDSISKLPVSSADVKASFGEEGRLHRFLHFDELFGHSDDDGLIGISTEGSTGELRKRVFASSSLKGKHVNSALVVTGPDKTPLLIKDQDAATAVPAPLRSSQINHTTHPQKRWNPWTVSRFGAPDTADEVAIDHRRALDKAEERMMRRKQAMAQGKMPQRRR